MELSADELNDLLATLRARFQNNMDRHRGIEWDSVRERLGSDRGKAWSLKEMERTGGEPDVIAFDERAGQFVFVDCSAETPIGRRNLCYDRRGQDERERKGVRPQGNAIDMAADMGIEILTEEQYHWLQERGEFDMKTSSWVMTPPPIRKLGGALFMDRRYDRVFVYHNSAPSFYSARGFRGSLRV